MTTSQASIKPSHRSSRSKSKSRSKSPKIESSIENRLNRILISKQAYCGTGSQNTTRELAEIAKIDFEAKNRNSEFLADLKENPTNSGKKVLPKGRLLARKGSKRVRSSRKRRSRRKTRKKGLKASGSQFALKSGQSPLRGVNEVTTTVDDLRADGEFVNIKKRLKKVRSKILAENTSKAKTGKNSTLFNSSLSRKQLGSLSESIKAHKIGLFRNHFLNQKIEKQPNKGDSRAQKAAIQQAKTYGGAKNKPKRKIKRKSKKIEKFEFYSKGHPQSIQTRNSKVSGLQTGHTIKNVAVLKHDNSRKVVNLAESGKKSKSRKMRKKSSAALITTTGGRRDIIGQLFERDKPNTVNKTAKNGIVVKKANLRFSKTSGKKKQSKGSPQRQRLLNGPEKTNFGINRSKLPKSFKPKLSKKPSKNRLFLERNSEKAPRDNTSKALMVKISEISRPSLNPKKMKNSTFGQNFELSAPLNLKGGINLLDIGRRDGWMSRSGSSRSSFVDKKVAILISQKDPKNHSQQDRDTVSDKEIPINLKSKVLDPQKAAKKIQKFFKNILSKNPKNHLNDANEDSHDSYQPKHYFQIQRKARKTNSVEKSIISNFRSSQALEAKEPKIDNEDDTGTVLIHNSSHEIDSNPNFFDVGVQGLYYKSDPKKPQKSLILPEGSSEASPRSLISRGMGPNAEKSDSESNGLFSKNSLILSKQDPAFLSSRARRGPIDEDKAKKEVNSPCLMTGFEDFTKKQIQNWEAFLTKIDLAGGNNEALKLKIAEFKKREELNLKFLKETMQKIEISGEHKKSEILPKNECRGSYRQSDPSASSYLRLGIRKSARKTHPMKLNVENCKILNLGNNENCGLNSNNGGSTEHNDRIFEGGEVFGWTQTVKNGLKSKFEKKEKLVDKSDGTKSRGSKKLLTLKSSKYRNQNVAEIRKNPKKSPNKKSKKVSKNSKNPSPSPQQGHNHTKNTKRAKPDQYKPQNEAQTPKKPAQPITQEKWIKPQQNVVRMMNKYISTSSRLMKSISIQPASISAVISRTKSGGHPSQIIDQYIDSSFNNPQSQAILSRRASLLEPSALGELESGSEVGKIKKLKKASLSFGRHASPIRQLERITQALFSGGGRSSGGFSSRKSGNGSLASRAKNEILGGFEAKESDLSSRGSIVGAINVSNSSGNPILGLKSPNGVKDEYGLIGQNCKLLRLAEVKNLKIESPALAESPIQRGNGLELPPKSLKEKEQVLSRIRTLASNLSKGMEIAHVSNLRNPIEVLERPLDSQSQNSVIKIPSQSEAISDQNNDYKTIKKVEIGPSDATMGSGNQICVDYRRNSLKSQNEHLDRYIQKNYIEKDSEAIERGFGGDGAARVPRLAVDRPFFEFGGDNTSSDSDRFEQKSWHHEEGRQHALGIWKPRHPEYRDNLIKNRLKDENDEIPKEVILSNSSESKGPSLVQKFNISPRVTPPAKKEPKNTRKLQKIENFENPQKHEILEKIHTHNPTPKPDPLNNPQTFPNHLLEDENDPQAFFQLREYLRCINLRDQSSHPLDHLHPLDATNNPPTIEFGVPGGLNTDSRHENFDSNNEGRSLISNFDEDLSDLRRQIEKQSPKIMSKIHLKREKLNQKNYQKFLNIDEKCVLVNTEMLAEVAGLARSADYALNQGVGAQKGVEANDLILAENGEIEVNYERNEAFGGRIDGLEGIEVSGSELALVDDGEDKSELLMVEKKIMFTGQTETDEAPITDTNPTVSDLKSPRELMESGENPKKDQKEEKPEFHKNEGKGDFEEEDHGRDDADGSIRVIRSSQNSNPAIKILDIQKFDLSDSNPLSSEQSEEACSPDLHKKSVILQGDSEGQGEEGHEVVEKNQKTFSSARELKFEAFDFKKKRKSCPLLDSLLPKYEEIQAEISGSPLNKNQFLGHNEDSKGKEMIERDVGCALDVPETENRLEKVDLVEEKNSENLKIVTKNEVNLEAIPEKDERKIPMAAEKIHEKYFEENDAKPDTQDSKEVEDITTALLEALIIECLLDPSVRKVLTKPHSQESPPQAQQPPQQETSQNSNRTSTTISKNNANNAPIDPRTHPSALNTRPTRPKLTDQELITNYLKCLFTAIEEQPEVQAGIHRRLNTPIGPTNLQKVKLFAPPFLTQRDAEVEIFEYSPVLDIGLYIQMEEILKQSVYLEEGLDEVQIERRHILHKMIYDSLNEVLDHRRVYGLEGKPLSCLSWFSEAPEIVEKEVFGILEKGQKQVLEYSQFRAGLLKENEPGLADVVANEVALQGVDLIEVLREEVVVNIVKKFVSSLEFELFSCSLSDRSSSLNFCLLHKYYFW